jgi:DNA end-binding protein Ku
LSTGARLCACAPNAFSQSYQKKKAREPEMTRALWKGDISFGLVTIPVELYPAEEHREFRFSMLDKRDFSPVGYKRYSKRSNKEVEWDNIVKGYEYEKGQYVVLSDEDFRRANVKASQTIDIMEFVPAEEIPTQYFETPYYLAPTERGKKVYALLRETLLSTGKVAIAQVVIRTTQHLAAVVPVGRALMLNTMRYADQLRDPEKIGLPEAGLKAAGVTTKEVELAKRLVDDMAGHWKPAEFKDTYHQDLMHRINEKIKNGETKQLTEPDAAAPDRPHSAQVIDLAALLQQSLKGDPRAGRKAQAAASSSAQPTSKTRAAAAKASTAAAKRKRA